MPLMTAETTSPGIRCLLRPIVDDSSTFPGHADAQQVVGVHHDRVLSDAFPYRCVARLAPVGVGESRLGSRSVGVHDEACLRIARERVRDVLQKAFG